MAKQRIIGFLCKEDHCVYLRDVTQSATLLASHRSGGFHRLMHSVAARTSYIKRFCKISTSSKARSKLRKAAGTNVGSHKKRQTMRKILLFLFALITAISLKGQDLSGFKYVFVPTLTYQNGGKDIW